MSRVIKLGIAFSNNKKIKSFEDKENPVEGNFSSGLEKFKVDTTKEN